MMSKYVLWVWENEPVGGLKHRKRREYISGSDPECGFHRTFNLEDAQIFSSADEGWRWKLDVTNARCS